MRRRGYGNESPAVLDARAGVRETARTCPRRAAKINAKRKRQRYGLPIKFSSHVGPKQALHQVVFKHNCNRCTFSCCHIRTEQHFFVENLIGRPQGGANRFSMQPRVPDGASRPLSASRKGARPYADPLDHHAPALFSPGQHTPVRLTARPSQHAPAILTPGQHMPHHPHQPCGTARKAIVSYGIRTRLTLDPPRSPARIADGRRRATKLGGTAPTRKGDAPP